MPSGSCFVVNFGVVAVVVVVVLEILLTLLFAIPAVGDDCDKCVDVGEGNSITAPLNEKVNCC